MSHLSSPTLNIHHRPESSATSLLFDADKSGWIEPVSKVKKTNLCIKEPLEEKSPRKWICSGGRGRWQRKPSCRHAAFQKHHQRIHPEYLWPKTHPISSFGKISQVFSANHLDASGSGPTKGFVYWRSERSKRAAQKQNLANYLNRSDQSDIGLVLQLAT